MTEAHPAHSTGGASRDDEGARAALGWPNGCAWSPSAGCAEHSQEEILADHDLTTARKGKTMTKHMTGDSEVERDRQENENKRPRR
jgi:hypothetical protein